MMLTSTKSLHGNDSLVNCQMRTCFVQVRLVNVQQLCPSHWGSLSSTDCELQRCIPLGFRQSRQEDTSGFNLGTVSLTSVADFQMGGHVCASSLIMFSVKHPRDVSQGCHRHMTNHMICCALLCQHHLHVECSEHEHDKLYLFYHNVFILQFVLSLGVPPHATRQTTMCP